MEERVTTVRIRGVHFPVTTMGPGTRLGLWVQGCRHLCPGCLAQESWNPTGGLPADVTDLAKLWAEAVSHGAQGLTVTGGEPLDQPAALGVLLAEVRAHSAADILVYTGYELDEAWRRAPQVLGIADAVITGRFDVTRPTKLIWRGSANQRLVPLTALGAERYGGFVDHESATVRLQLGGAGNDRWLIGVPRADHLPQIMARLRRAGMSMWVSQPQTYRQAGPVTRPARAPGRRPRFDTRCSRDTSDSAG